MPGHVIFSLESFKLSKSTKKQDCTKEPYPQKYGSTAQSESVDPVNNSSLLRPPDINWIQHIIGCFLYYAWALDAKMLLAWNTIANEQAAPTEQTKQCIKHLLDYKWTHPKTIIHDGKSNMTHNVHLGVSYLLHQNLTTQQLDTIF